ncbi:MAG: ROK family protein, partial [Clostridiales bacterium]|nr:ROK family protein [Clostridiales bacterium]
RKNGQIDSDLIGRKAVAYSIVPDYRIAVGVDISLHQIKIMLIDLYGSKIDRVVVDCLYSDAETYYQDVCSHILACINAHDIRDEQILGIGIAMQGLVSPDHTRMVYGKILECTGLKIEAFSRHLPYPCSFIHDAKSAATCERWFSPELNDAFFLHLNDHFGAALIQNGEVVNGKHGHNSTVEHIVLDPNGPLCYCGKRGCAETFCSLKSLLQNEKEEDFFAALRSGDRERQARWQNLLDHLALLIASLHLVCDIDFILSGYLADHITEQELQYLYDKIREQTPFEEQADFLKIGKMPKHSITVGAALPYIRRFLDTLE